MSLLAQTFLKKLLMFCIFSFSMIYAQENTPKQSVQEIKYGECFPAFDKLPDFTIFRAEKYVHSDLYYQIINYLIDNNLTDYEACLDDMKRVLSEEFIQEMNDTFYYFDFEIEDLTEEAEMFKKIITLSLDEIKDYLNEDYGLEEKNENLLMLIRFFEKRNQIEKIESLIPLLDNINPDIQKRSSHFISTGYYYDQCWKDQGKLILMKLYFKMKATDKALLLFDEIEDQRKKIQAFALMTQFYYENPFFIEGSFECKFIDGVFIEPPHNFMFWLCMNNFAPEIYYYLMESYLKDGKSLLMLKNSFDCGSLYVDRNRGTYIEDYIPYNFVQGIHFIINKKYSDIANVDLPKNSVFEKIINTRLMEEYYNNEDWKNFDNLINEYLPLSHSDEKSHDYDERQVIAMQSYLKRGDFESAINNIRTKEHFFWKNEQFFSHETIKIMMYYIVKKSNEQN